MPLLERGHLTSQTSFWRRDTEVGGWLGGGLQQMPAFQAWCHRCQRRWCLHQSAPTQLNDQQRTRFQHIKAGFRGCSREAAAEHQNPRDCCFWAQQLRPAAAVCRARCGAARRQQGPFLYGWEQPSPGASSAPVELQEHRRTDGRRREFAALRAGGPGCGDRQRVVNYLNMEWGKGNGRICRTSFQSPSSRCVYSLTASRLSPPSQLLISQVFCKRPGPNVSIRSCQDHTAGLRLKGCTQQVLLNRVHLTLNQIFR